jgi:hypothetical protein
MEEGFDTNLTTVDTRYHESAKHANPVDRVAYAGANGRNDTCSDHYRPKTVARVPRVVNVHMQSPLPWWLVSFTTFLFQSFKVLFLEIDNPCDGNSTPG